MRLNDVEAQTMVKRGTASNDCYENPDLYFLAPQRETLEGNLSLLVGFPQDTGVENDLILRPISPSTLPDGQSLQRGRTRCKSITEHDRHDSIKHGLLNIIPDDKGGPEADVILSEPVTCNLGDDSSPRRSFFKRMVVRHKTLKPVQSASNLGQRLRDRWDRSRSRKREDLETQKVAAESVIEDMPPLTPALVSARAEHIENHRASNVIKPISFEPDLLCPREDSARLPRPSRIVSVTAEQDNDDAESATPPPIPRRRKEQIWRDHHVQDLRYNVQRRKRNNTPSYCEDDVFVDTQFQELLDLPKIPAQSSLDHSTSSSTLVGIAEEEPESPARPKLNAYTRLQSRETEADELNRYCRRSCSFSLSLQSTDDHSQETMEKSDFEKPHESSPEESSRNASRSTAITMNSDLSPPSAKQTSPVNSDHQGHVGFDQHRAHLVSVWPQTPTRCYDNSSHKSQLHFRSRTQSSDLAGFLDPSLSFSPGLSP